MFFSNSAIVIRVNNLNEKKLKNFSFFEKNNTENLSRKFYSMNFYNDKNDIGEIHYTNSFEYGKMNVINFIRKSNLFFLFTSSVQHSKFFKKAIKMLLKEDITFEILKIPVSRSLLQNNQKNNLNIIEADEIYGIVAMLKFQDETNHLIKIYNNGLITFPFTNNKELIKEIINSFLFLMKND